MLLVHGVKDEVVIVDSTDDFVRAMEAAGAEISCLRYGEAGHGVMGQKSSETTPAVIDFFKKHLP